VTTISGLNSCCRELTARRSRRQGTAILRKPGPNRAGPGNLHKLVHRRSRFSSTVNDTELRTRSLTQGAPKLRVRKQASGRHYKPAEREATVKVNRRQIQRPHRRRAASSSMRAASALRARALLSTRPLLRRSTTIHWWNGRPLKAMSRLPRSRLLMVAVDIRVVNSSGEVVLRDDRASGAGNRFAAPWRSDHARRPLLDARRARLKAGSRHGALERCRV
jgi:hypothetical protein